MHYRYITLCSVLFISTILSTASILAMDQERRINPSKIQDLKPVRFLGDEILHLSPNWNRCLVYQTPGGEYYKVVSLLRHQLWSSTNYYGFYGTQFRLDDDKCCDWNKFSAKPGQGQVLFDGPNENGLCLVAHNKTEWGVHASSHYIQQLTGQTVSTPLGPGLWGLFYNYRPLGGRDFKFHKYFTYEHPDQAKKIITAAALGSGNRYALCYAPQNTQQEQSANPTICIYDFKKGWLRMFNSTQLVKEIPITVPLQKLSFIKTCNKQALLGLSQDGCLCEINIATGELSKETQKIKDFAVDARNPERIVVLTENNTILHRNFNENTPHDTPITINNPELKNIITIWFYRNRLAVKFEDKTISIYALEGNHESLPQPKKKAMINSFIRKYYKIALRNPSITFGIPMLCVGLWAFYNLHDSHKAYAAV